MKKISFILAAVCFLFFSGCEEETGDFSRYPSISIPQFTKADYLKLLSDKNPEVVCSAIVSLGQEAADMGAKLSDEKADKTSAEYLIAANTYKKIIGLLNSHNPRIAAVSLRFLQRFGSRYNAKEELIAPVLKVKSSNPLVLYEQVNALKIIANKNSKIPIKTVRQFLNNRSWIVSRSAYSLVDSLENNMLRRELIHKYRATKDSKEKLLILTAMETRYDDYVADFLFAEALTTKDSKIRHKIFNMLSGAEDQNKILSLIGKNYEKLITIDGQYLFQQNALTMEETFSGKLLSIFIAKGFPAGEKFLEAFNEKLEEYKEKLEAIKKNKDGDPSDLSKLGNLMQLEKVVSENKALSEKWALLKDKTKALDARLNQLQKEYDTIAQEYVPKIDMLFKKYDIPDKKRQEYKDAVLDSREYLKEMLINKKENSAEENN